LTLRNPSWINDPQSHARFKAKAMLTFNCRCGNAIEVISPSPHAGYLVWDSDIDLSIDSRTAHIRAFLSALKTGTRDQWLAHFYGKNAPQSRLTEKDDVDVIEDILSRQDSWTRQTFRCPVCGRLYVQRQPSGDDFRCYDEEPS
jgi:hypothetical protein